MNHIAYATKPDWLSPEYAQGVTLWHWYLTTCPYCTPAPVCFLVVALASVWLFGSWHCLHHPHPFRSALLPLCGKQLVCTLRCNIGASLRLCVRCLIWTNSASSIMIAVTSWRPKMWFRPAIWHEYSHPSQVFDLSLKQWSALIS
jgi:hypothetical protein